MIAVFKATFKQMLWRTQCMAMQMYLFTSAQPRGRACLQVLHGSWGPPSQMLMTLTITCYSVRERLLPLATGRIRILQSPISCNKHAGQWLTALGDSMRMSVRSSGLPSASAFGNLSLVIQAWFWSLRTRAMLSKRRANVEDECPLCGIAQDTVPNRLGGCSHPDITTKVKHRQGAALSQIVHAIESGRHGDCFTLHDAEGHDAGYRRLPTLMLQMRSMPSRPDIVLLEDSERGPGGRVLGYIQAFLAASGGGYLHHCFCTCRQVCREGQATSTALLALASGWLA